MSVQRDQRDELCARVLVAHRDVGRYAPLVVGIGDNEHTHRTVCSFNSGRRGNEVAVGAGCFGSTGGVLAVVLEVDHADLQWLVG